jgi:hypothetical protein
MLGVGMLGVGMLGATYRLWQLESFGDHPELKAFLSGAAGK